MTDVAQLVIYIRGVDASLNVTEEFVSVVPMTDTTTANDVFVSVGQNNLLSTSHVHYKYS